MRKRCNILFCYLGENQTGTSRVAFVRKTYTKKTNDQQKNTLTSCTSNGFPRGSTHDNGEHCGLILRGNRIRGAPFTSSVFNSGNGRRYLLRLKRIPRSSSGCLTRACGFSASRTYILYFTNIVAMV